MNDLYLTSYILSITGFSLGWYHTIKRACKVSDSHNK